MLAALAYSRNRPGVWFLNPPQWVTHHMFKEASIWEIPLVKPRFGCSVDMSLSLAGFDMASALQQSFENFKGEPGDGARGGGCVESPWNALAGREPHRSRERGSSGS